MGEGPGQGDAAIDAVPDGIVIRRAVDDDAAEIAEVFLASFRATYAFAGVHTDEEVRRWVRGTVVATEEAWVAVDPDGSMGVMALDGNLLDQLYLRPGRTGRDRGASPPPRDGPPAGRTEPLHLPGE